MGLSDPYDTAAYDAFVARVTVGSPTLLSGAIEIREYDPAWASRYEQEAARVTRALGEQARRIEHVGSTSVPGLPAKPIVDIVLEVLESADEPAYVPALESAGYALRIREPDWCEHRMLRTPGGDAHLPVFSAGYSETDRMVAFRDDLRGSARDRDLYARTAVQRVGRVVAQASS